jgi:hypothetical protein
MNIPLHPQNRRRGSVLLMTAIIAIVAAGLLGYVLVTAQQEYNMVTRSQAWNSAMVQAEAGVEEALTLINYNNWPFGTNITADGWVFTNDVFSITRTLNSQIGSYTIYVTNTGIGPTILSVGTAYCNDVSLHKSFNHRAVVVTTRSTYPFPGALTMQQGIDMNGNNVTIDSFDSSDPYHSSWPNYPGAPGYGVYTNTGSTVNSLRKANGNVATDGSIVGVINVGNAQVYGYVDTGPGGTATIGANGSVGDVNWVNGGNTGLDPGWSHDDMNVAFPDVTLPATNWTSLPNNTDITNAGYYTMDQINANMNITASNVVVYATNGIVFNGNKTLTIGTNAAAVIYLGGSFNDGGNGTVNNASQHASQLIVYGLPSLGSVTLHGNGAFWGAFYAPEASVSFKGAGNSGGFYGSLTASNIVLTGNSSFSYDEALRKLAINNGYVVTSWAEVSPP